VWVYIYIYLCCCLVGILSGSKRMSAFETKSTLERLHLHDSGGNIGPIKEDGGLLTSSVALASKKARHNESGGNDKGCRKAQKIADAFSTIIDCLGEDVTREGLVKTPMRAANAMLYFTKGYNEKVENVINGALFQAEGNGMVVVKDIEVHSMCEHHLVPFHGVVHVGYIPNQHIIGLSKFARIVEVFARRLQVQERLTNEVAESIERVLKPAGVAVVVECTHMCMVMRGVEKSGSRTCTRAMTGVFKDDANLRAEFFSMVNSSRR
jgi:GTP cyclohydrolase IA